MKFLHFGLLCNVATLALNVVTLIVPPPGTSRSWFSMSRRQFFPSLERRGVESQRRDVGFIPSLERRDVGNSTLGNVATLSPNVATLPCFRPETLHILVLPSHSPSRTLTHPCRNPLLQIPTTEPPLPPPVFTHSRQSSAPVSRIHHHTVVP